ncbi:MAG: DUF6448 family protein [Verrucomicrobiota bacterium]
MKTIGYASWSAVLVTAFALVFVGAGTVLAHCDTLDGPVVKAAKQALESGDVNLILIWVQPKDEAEIRQAFEKTVAVRKLSDDAKALADLYFFETLVRVHRAGEGFPYTGLKSAGQDLGPAIPAADAAIESGSAENVMKLIHQTVHGGVQRRFQEVLARKDFKSDDVAAGREFVESYVKFLHYVEGVYEAAAKGAAHGHGKAEAGHEGHEE